MKSSELMPRKISEWTGKGALILSGLLLISLSCCYLFKPDFFAVITFYPAWTWTISGLFLAALGLLANKRVSLIAMLVWLVFVAMFSEEPRSLCRSVLFCKGWGTITKKQNAIRVISLNCAGGNLKAAEEVIRYKPDIVLLQEAPTRKDVEGLARDLFKDNGTVIWNIDTAVIVRGHASQNISPHKTNMFMTQTHVRLMSGIEASVISVHLFPPTIDMNLFSPDCWQKHKEDRQLRRSQIEKIVAQLDSIPENVPVIVGGDFNTTADDGAIRLLGPRLRDSFREGGIGWGHTAFNNMPLFRVDQIWINKHFKPLAVFSKRTEHSDHRMVICDLRPKLQTVATDSFTK